MSEVLEALRDEQGEAVSDLTYRIDRDREFVRIAFVLGEAPRRPFSWLRRARAA